MPRKVLIATGAIVALAAAGGGIWFKLHGGDGLAQARGLMDAGDTRSAQLVLRNYLRDHPDNSEAHYQLGRLQVGQGDGVGGEHELREAQASGMDEHAIRPLLARALAEQRRGEAVLRDFNIDGLTTDQAADLHIARSIAALQQSQPEVAKQDIDAAVAAKPGSATIAVAAARVYLATHDTSSAASLNARARQADPHYYPALVQQAEILAQQGDAAGAIAAFDTALADPSSKSVNPVPARLARADLNLARGKDGLARPDVEAVLKIAPRNPVANYELAVLDAHAGQWRQADEALTNVGPALSAFPRGDILLATVKANAAEPQQALDAAEHYVNRHPQDLAGAKLLASINLMQRRPEAAQRVLAPWAQAQPSDPEVLTIVSQSYAMAGQAGPAQDALLRAGAASQNDAKALSRIARIAMQEGNPGLGADLLERALADEEVTGQGSPVQRVQAQADAPTTPGPSRSDDAAALVVTALRAGQVDRAASALDTLKTSHADPERIDMLTGAVKLAQFDLAAARAAFESARARNPALPQAAIDLARVMQMQGDGVGATGILRDALTKNPAAPALLSSYTGALWAQNDGAAAVAAAEDAHNAAPDNIAIDAILAETYVMAKQPEKALTLSSALPSDSPVQLGLRADAEHALGHKKEALAAWQSLLGKLPDDVALRRRVASILASSGQPDQALQIIDDGLKTSQTNSSLQSDAVILTARISGLDAGLARADALAAKSQTFSSLLLRGDLLRANGRAADAAAAYAKVRETLGASAKSAEAEDLILRQAGALAISADRAGSVKLLTDWQKDHPGAVAITEALAENDIVAGYLPEARQKLEAVLRAQPNNAAALNNLAWVQQQQGEFASSLANAQRAFAVAPSPQSADTLGWSLVKTGKAGDALGLLRQAAASQRDPAVLYHLAAALKDVGKAEEARAVLKPALDSKAQWRERNDAELLMQSLGGA